MEEQSTQVTQTKSNKKIIIGVVVFVVAVLLLGGGFFLFTNNGTPVTNQVETTVPNTNTQADQVSEESQVIAVEGGNYYYNPDEIKVKAGQKVTIQLNAVGMMHDFVIDELGIKSPIVQSGKTAAVEFTPTMTGEYTYYCSVGNHRAQGMEGTLIVE